MKSKDSDTITSADRGLLLAFFWGLIWVKCFWIEYASQRYEMEINTLFYVWIPSLVMGMVCSILYFSHWSKQSDTTQVWEKVILGTLIVAAIFSEPRLNVPPVLLPFGLAFMLGVGFFMRTRKLESAPYSRVLAVLWVLASFSMFAFDEWRSFFWMGWFLILLLVIPSALHYFQNLFHARIPQA